MKNIFLISLISILCFSCVKDPEETYNSSKKNQYKIVNFYSVDDISVDLNYDGIKNSDIMLEVDYYFDNFRSFDLEEIISMRRTGRKKSWETGERFFHFILPKQYFYPDTYPPFIKTDFIFEESYYNIELDMDKDNFYKSIYIDDENSVLQFEKTSETQYEAIIEKKYYDFATTSYVKHKYKVVFEKM